MSSLDVHKRIKKAILDIEKTHEKVCTNVETIAEKAGTDTRTTRKHLAILEENGIGVFCDPKRKTFSSKDKLERLKRK